MQMLRADGQRTKRQKTEQNKPTAVKIARPAKGRRTLSTCSSQKTDPKTADKTDKTDRLKENQRKDELNNRKQF